MSISKLARTKNGAEAAELFQLSYDKYQQAVLLKEKDHDTYYNWANTLYRHAFTNPPHSELWANLLNASGTLELIF